MEENIKFELRQEFETEDYIHLNKLIKHDKSKQIDMKQVVQGLLLICISFCFLALLRNNMFEIIISCIGLSILSIFYYLISFVYRENTFFARLLFRRYIYESLIFYEDFMQVKNFKETVLIFYDDIEEVYETQSMLYLKLMKNKRYVFITKKNLVQVLYFLKTKKRYIWHIMDENQFHL